MKILAMIGSPRKGSNTDILVDQLLKGAEENGHDSQKLYLYQYDIKPCVDCRKCKAGEPVCALKDDMTDLYPLIDKADVLVFGTPNYWYGPSAKMKLLIDRIRPYVESRILEGKAAMVAIPAGEGPPACGPMMEAFKMSFKYLGMKFAGAVLGEAYERKEILDKPDSLQEAYELGKSLVE
jgi:multimeric flavodoxin WrbA